MAESVSSFFKLCSDTLRLNGGTIHFGSCFSCQSSFHMMESESSGLSTVSSLRVTIPNAAGLYDGSNSQSLSCLIETIQVAPSPRVFQNRTSRRPHHLS